MFVKVAASASIDPHSPGLRELITALPATPGIYLVKSPDKPPYLSWSVNLPRRLLRLLVSSYTAPSNLLGKLRDNLAAVECWCTGSKLETSLLMYQLAKEHFPADYLFRLRLRMPWVVGLTSNDAFPRLIVVNRIRRNAGALFGPFASRDLAQYYAEELMGLFQIRRCTETLEPSTGHPGCIYGEMNQCLRPCQCAVTAEEYGTEVGRVSEFLASNGKTAMGVLLAARDRAAEETDFEQAAQIHKRIERIKGALESRHEVIAEIQRFNGVALTRSAQSRRFRLWPMVGGYWQGPLDLDFSADGSGARSLDHELRERLSRHLAEPRTDGKRIEELALFSRWYYSSWRDGQWFPFRTLADLNYRRLVREISSLVKASPPM
jgi:excinuclease ABC subunit C